MQFEVLADANEVAQQAAKVIAQEARAAVASHGRFVFAVSGGRTPWVMLKELAKEDLPWGQIQIVQVDERVAPDGHPDRNLTQLRSSLANAPIRAEQIHAMPVTESDLQSACGKYSGLLRQLTDSSGVLDLVHLGLGADGHTASLVPNDPVLEVADSDVALTGLYQGRLRMTLTYPILNRSRKVLWVVTGSEKIEMLARLQQGDKTIPAGRIQCTDELILADAAATGSSPV